MEITSDFILVQLCHHNKAKIHINIMADTNNFYRSKHTKEYIHTTIPAKIKNFEVQYLTPSNGTNRYRLLHRHIHTEILPNFHD